MSAQPAPKPRRPRWHYAVGALVLCGVLGALGSLVDDDDDGASTPRRVADRGAAQTGATAEPTATDIPPTEAPLAPSWAEMKAVRDETTDVGWDAYRKPLAGQRVVDWPATVSDVRAAGKGYRVSVDFDSNDPFSLSDAFIETDDPAAATWAKDAAVVVSGTIKRVDSVLGKITVDFEDGADIRTP